MTSSKQYPPLVKTRRLIQALHRQRRLMFRYLGVVTAGVLLAVEVLTGCKPKSPVESARPVGCFQTPFQNESQFVLETIVSDLAEQTFYAAYHRLPNPKEFAVTATEKPGSPPDAPVYDLKIRLDAKKPDLKSAVTVSSPIWSPSNYLPLAEALARAVGLKAVASEVSESTQFLQKLADISPETIEQKDQELSAALEADFTNPQLHEAAAALLGAFLLRDHSGNFFEMRLPLSRMTAHLTMASSLSSTHSYRINGRMAEAMQLTLIGDQALAMERLSALGTNDVVLAPIVRALRMRNTGDYLMLDEPTGLTEIESVEWFIARAEWIGAASAWPKLNDVEQRTIDYIRVANQEDYSVEMGHELLAASIPLELQEAGTVYKLLRHGQLAQRELVEALNELPERCFQRGTDGTIHVQVLGWGQWAIFLQRHLCHALVQNFNHMQRNWGVPEDAKQFADTCDRDFGELRLYPFVQRMNATEVESYHKSVDAGIKITLATPHLVPTGCWDWLFHGVNFAPSYPPDFDPHINEWFDHNPLPGTAYDLAPRFPHPTLVDRSDVIALFEKLHELAPYDCRIVDFLLTKKYNNHPTYDQAMALYREMLPYSVTALRTVANTVYDRPDQYERLMTQAAKLNPACYYELGDYALSQHLEDKAAQFIDQACAGDPDTVRASNHSIWRVRYYLKKGQVDKARAIADEAGEVYSSEGLQAKAIFLESTHSYDGAFNWYAKVVDRYDDPAPLVDFCFRYRSQTGDSRFEPELQKLLKRFFPKGMEKVTLASFHNPPTDGVSINGQNGLITSAGLKAGDVIVAVYGVRVHSYRQYCCARGLKHSPELELIVWQGDAYREFKPSSPNHRFRVDFGDFKAK